MQSEILPKRSLLIFSIVGFTISSIVILFLIFNLPVQSSYTNSTLNNNKPVKSIQTVGLPISLKIPKINVDAVIERVGLTSDGSVGVPKGPVNAAWFNLSPHPGDIGSAVITGHYGIWKSGIPTVFNNLYKLNKGDKIYIKDDRGAIITFVVRESKNYNPKTDASDVFVLNDGKAHLNLITCEGIWNKVSKSYSKRLVVFADKE